MTIHKDRRGRADRSRTVGERMRTLSLLSHLKEYLGYEHLTRASRPMPQDLTAGLTHVHRSIWNGGKVFAAIVIYIRIVVNMVGISLRLQEVLTRDNIQFQSIHQHGHRIVMFGDRVVTCDLDTGNATASPTCTTHTMSRLGAWKAMVIFEAIIGLPLGLLTILFVSAFLVHCPERKHSRYTYEHPPQPGFLHSLPSRSPGWFFFAPRAAAGFSALIFLDFLNLKRWQSLVLHGEGRLWQELFLFSLCPACKESAKKESTYSYEQVGSEPTSSICCRYCRICIQTVIYICLLLLSVQALLAKLTSMHFIGVSDFRTWDFNLVFAFVSFLNQVVGSMDFFDHELSRVIFFVFGASDAELQKEETQATSSYFGMLAQKIVTGKIYRYPAGRFMAVAAMATFDADDMQRLLLSPIVEKRIIQGEEERRKLHESINQVIHSGQYYNALADAQREQHNGNLEEAHRLLKKAQEQRAPQLENIRDEMLKKAMDETSPVAPSYMFFLAAEAQDNIEDVKNLTFSDDDVDEIEEIETDDEDADESEY